ADMNDDGVVELVPASDQAGPLAPARSYMLFSPQQPQAKVQTLDKTGIYVGGSIYSDWAHVPEKYKAMHPQDSDSRRSTASIFTFKW
ncbi:MAG TPA: hypothetical protein VIG78_02665, partial [Gemmatimonadaceae bacterium]